VSERDAAALDAVITISRTLSGEADLAAVLDLVAKRGRALISARALAIEVREGGRMAVAAVAGELPEGLGAARERVGGSVLVVPLALRGRAYGALAAVDRQEDGPRFTLEDEELLEALAALAASAVAAQKFGRAQRPVVLDHVGLAGAIELLADLAESPRLEIRTGLDFALEEGRVGSRFDGEVETAIYRIVQEALDNAVKHAGASRVQVEVTQDSELEGVKVRIEDDGDGFDPATERDGSGLAGMRERAELLGGFLRIHSSPGQGTRITATLPPGSRLRSMLNID
jgi:signal transduction histidine kinase